MTNFSLYICFIMFNKRDLIDHIYNIFISVHHTPLSTQLCDLLSLTCLTRVTFVTSLTCDSHTQDELISGKQEWLTQS